MCVVLCSGSGRADESVTGIPVAVVGPTEVDPQDIEIINDLDLFENWDDLQDEKGFEKDMSEDQETEGGGHE